MDFKVSSFVKTVDYTLNCIAKAFYLMDNKTITTLHIYYLNTTQITLTFSLNRSIFQAKREICQTSPRTLIWQIIFMSEQDPQKERELPGGITIPPSSDAAISHNLKIIS